MTDDFPPVAASKPFWLVTLADLALLLVGFLLLQQALAREDPMRLAAALRSGFGTDDAPMPVAATALDGFAPGSATLPRDPADVIAWANATVADPRVSIAIAGGTDGSRGDIDPITHSTAILAADRARALATALIAGGVPSDRLMITTSITTRRAAIANIVFAGQSGLVR